MKRSWELAAFRKPTKSQAFVNLLDDMLPTMFDACAESLRRYSVAVTDRVSRDFINLARRGTHKHAEWELLPYQVRSILRQSEVLVLLCVPLTYGRKRTWLNKDLIRRLASYM